MFAKQKYYRVMTQPSVKGFFTACRLSRSRTGRGTTEVRAAVPQVGVLVAYGNRAPSLVRSEPGKLR